MNTEIAKTTKRSDPAAPTQDAASRLKADLMQDALGRMFGEDDKKPIASGIPRVLLALANHSRSPGWERAKVLQRQMYEAAASGLEIKFAFFAQDDDEGVRRFKITSQWIDNPDVMAGRMDNATCDCGCFVYIRRVLEQAVRENRDRPMRTVVIVGDAFHDDQEGLDEAALAANQLRREGTRVFLIQQGDDPDTARKLQYLARVSGAAYFEFDPKTQQQQFVEMLELVSVYSAGGEEAVQATSGKTATMLLEHLKQQPMSILDEEREPVLVSTGAARPVRK